VAVVRAWGAIAGVVLALILWFVAAPTVLPAFMTAEYYYQLRSVTVKDAYEGNSPRMIVDRTIRRQFRGRYEIQILRAEGGEYVAFWACGEHKSSWQTYRPEARLPEDLDLDWWMGIPPNRECELPPGQYRVVTTIFARGPFNAELSTERSSMPFTIRAKPKEKP
jgi:hypothetical protein